jgi:oligoendopeptidase F
MKIEGRIMPNNHEQLLTRDAVPVQDRWDLSSLYLDEASWESDLQRFVELIEGYASFQGRLADSPETLAQLLEFDLECDRLAERLGAYAFLRTTEDQADSSRQARQGRFQHVAVKAGQAASFIRPEILAFDAERWNRFLASEPLAPYRLLLERLMRYRPHTLGSNEERLLAMQGEMAQTASQIFHQLVDADLKFGQLQDGQGALRELTVSSFTQLLEDPVREVRQKTFAQFYDQFQGHQNTLAASLSGSILTNVYYARARNYANCRQAALIGDNVPESVYDSLIAAVRRHLPSVHRYYELRRRKMGLEQIHHYDTYVPILSGQRTHRSWDQAVDLVLESLSPLGSDYIEPLANGLRGGWCDRYPNRGKQSGAFSCGTYDGWPYILMNYRPDVLNDIFTLAHEAGHSMHSYFSARHQPFVYYNYTIFVAEVASTFNEQLLGRHLIERASSHSEKAFLINHEIDSIRATIVRQTMFAEFELKTHTMAEAGEPLTVDAFRQIYQELLEDYFGPDFVIDPQLSLECFRIPHFYRAFYVYKYATGLSAAISLANRVLAGGKTERDAYFGFLKGGCSKDPLDLLVDAGVDLSRPEPVTDALGHFDRLVTELEQLLQ